MVVRRKTAVTSGEPLVAPRGPRGVDCGAERLAGDGEDAASGPSAASSEGDGVLVRDAAKLADLDLEDGEALVDAGDDAAAVDGIGLGHSVPSVATQADPTPEGERAFSARAEGQDLGPGDPPAMAVERLPAATDKTHRQAGLRVVTKDEIAARCHAAVIDLVARRSEGGQVDLDLEKALALLGNALVAMSRENWSLREALAIGRARECRISEEARHLASALEAERARRIRAESRLEAAREWMKLKQVKFANAELASDDEGAAA